MVKQPTEIISALENSGEPYILIFGGTKSTIKSNKDNEDLPQFYSNMILPMIVTTLQATIQHLIQSTRGRNE